MSAVESYALKWPPNYGVEMTTRQANLLNIRNNPKTMTGAIAYYRTHPIEFIEHWCETIDPRNVGKPGKLTRMPFVLFPKQKEFIAFLFDCYTNEHHGLVEKSRDMGATWCCVAFSVWLLLFHPGAAVGWGSRKAILVDRIGDMDSIFEKVRSLLTGIPKEFGTANIDMAYMKIINRSNGASITGESGDEIGRGGRKRIYFKDESAHYEHPEAIEAALGDNTNVQIDISSVTGPGTVFHRRRESGIEWQEGIVLRKGGPVCVFVLDWSDHPDKDQEWYDAREEKAINEGLEHKFRQEVDRRYDAAIVGTIIPLAWIRSSIDAHKKIAGLEEGAWCAALDVADEGADRNASAKRKGVVLKYVKEWGARDTGATARLAIEFASGHGAIDVQYDSIGVGSGVKSETNRLSDEKLMPKGMRFVAWDAGASPLDPEGHVITLSNGKPDKDSPINKDFYQNLKAQGWWLLRRRFERTHKAIVEGDKYDPDDLISIDSSSIPPVMLRQIEKELSQVTRGKSARLKMLINKTPEGTKSPNVGDAIMMCYHPATPKKSFNSSYDWVG